MTRINSEGFYVVLFNTMKKSFSRIMQHHTQEIVRARLWFTFPTFLINSASLCNWILVATIVSWISYAHYPLIFLFKPQLTSKFPIFHRIFGAFLALSFYIFIFFVWDLLNLWEFLHEFQKILFTIQDSKKWIHWVENWNKFYYHYHHHMPHILEAYVN